MAHFPTTNESIRVLLSHGEQFRDGMVQLVGTFSQMKTGDGSQAAHYALIKTALGLATDASAQSAVAEFEAAKGALDGIAATLSQLFNEFRQI